jgi:hypothetical protein
VEFQVPITGCGKVAFKLPAKVKRPAKTQMIHRYLETNFMIDLVSWRADTVVVVAGIET